MLTSMQKLTLVLLSSLLLAACGGGNTSATDSGDSTRTDTAHAAHGHHGEHSHANAYMNQSGFDELVQRFEGEEREAWQQPAKVLDHLGELEGKTVADLGAGTGYFSVRLAERGAKVIALDIDERFISYINERKTGLQQEVAGRIEARQCGEDDSRLKPAEVDLVFSVNTYHHISERPAYFKKLRSCIRPGGRLVIVDFKAGDLPVGPPADHKVALEDMKKELAEAGFAHITADEKLLEYQFVLTAE
jgi:SAM-dependent methyltransferase